MKRLSAELLDLESLRGGWPLTGRLLQRLHRDGQRAGREQNAQRFKSSHVWPPGREFSLDKPDALGCTLFGELCDRRS